ncbi:MAG: cobalamin-dependent protein, partial [bacterium]|nr:cobalamin-dependent protein [bacterium]
MIKDMSCNKVLLIYPPTNSIGGTSDSLWMLEPLGLEYVAAACSESQVLIIDMRFEPDIFRAIKAFKPDLIAFTSLTCHVNAVIGLAVKIKHYWPYVKIVIGGQHATVKPEDFEIPQVDYIVRGDGYSVMRELMVSPGSEKNIVGLSSNDGGSFNKTAVRDYEDLDTQPFPRRELVKKYSSSYRYEWHFGVSSIRTSVGCPFKCSFCSVDALSAGKYIKRSVKNIVSELESISSRI